MKYLNFYSISQDSELSVANSLSGDVWNISFNRNFGDEEVTQWEDLNNSIIDVDLNDERDTMVWCFEKSVFFFMLGLFIDS